MTLEEGPDPAKGQQSGFAAFIAVAAAVVALFGSGAVVLAGRAADASHAAARSGEAAAAATAADQRVADASYRREFERWVDVTRFDRRRTGADLSADAAVDARSVAAQRRRAQAWATVQSALAAHDPLLADAATAPNWAQLRTQLGAHAHADSLVQQAAADLSGRWDRRTNRFQAVVVLTAAVLLLLGICVSLGRRASAVPLGVAGLLLTGAAVFVATEQHRPLAAVLAAAIAETARGDTAMDLGDYPGARHHYDQAIRLAPRYVRPYARRGLLSESEHEQSLTFVSFIPARSAAAARVDLERAIQLGAGDDLETVLDLGFADVVLNDYESALGQYRHAVALNPASPLNWGNLALAQLATGDEQGSVESYHTSALRIGALSSLADRLALRYSSLGDLELLGRLRPGLAAAIGRARSGLVSVQAAESLQIARVGRETAAVRGAKLAFSRGDHGRPTVTFTVSGTRGADRHVSVIWYRRLAGQPAYFADSEMATNSFLLINSDGDYSTTDYPVSDCGAAGDYRADIYVGDRLATSVRARATSSSLTGMSFINDAELGVGFCRPPTWQLSSEPGRRVALTAPTGEQFSVELSPRQVGADESPGAAARSVLDDATQGRTPVGTDAPLTVTSAGGNLDAFSRRVDTGPGRADFISVIVDGHRLIVVRQVNVDPSVIVSDDIFVTLYLSDPIK